jgi:hypothetical protein
VDLADIIERHALHEAGHAVACVLGGVAVAKVTLDATAQGSKVTFAAEILDPTVEVLVRLAGNAAEGLAFGSYDPTASVDDRARAADAAWRATRDLYAADTLVCESRAAVRDLLSDHWPAVEAIALALLEGSGTLSGDEVNAAIARGPLADDLAAARRASLSVCRPLANLAPGEQ